MSSFYDSESQIRDAYEFCQQPTEDLFKSLVSRGNSGTRVRSTAAPALATAFVKSPYGRIATAETDGSLAEVEFMHMGKAAERCERRHDDDNLFGYTSSLTTDSMPGGYGERSARALAREESTFQLKGVFPSAVLSYSKLRARIEAREGHVESWDSIFAQMWGLPVSALEELPQLHLAGSEPTRMSAMEDRAYHSTAVHPAYNGGFRVDLATIASDSLGVDVPINWPRIRHSLKAIALVQLQGDLAMQESIKTVTGEQAFSLHFDVVQRSQPEYSRPGQWEVVMDKIVSRSHVKRTLVEELEQAAKDNAPLAMGWTDDAFKDIIENEEHQISDQIREIANLVAEESNESFKRTVDIIMTHDRERAAFKDMDNEEADNVGNADISESFDVPRYKIKRTTLYSGFKMEHLGTSDLPDVESHGKPRLLLDLEELREARLTLPLDVGGIMNLAVFLTVARPRIRPYAYELMALVGQSVFSDVRPISRRDKLRSQQHYESQKIRDLGRYIFEESFRETVELIIRNVSTKEYRMESSLKSEIWDYLSGRTRPRRKCPFLGDWRDLLTNLYAEPEGWTLYYWARRSIGKVHHNFSAGIFTPITAGREVDLLVAIRRGVHERARGWADYYAGQYKAMVSRLEEELSDRHRQRRAMLEAEEGQEIKKYIPPHLRQMAQLRTVYKEEVERTGGFTKQEYEKMVEYQSKSKFFSQLNVYTQDRRVIVGLSDNHMRETFIEFYHARWYRLHQRLTRDLKKGEPLRVGPHMFYEHPWGELMTEFEPDLPGLLAQMGTLDSRAWTVSPHEMYMKLKKSISEFWSDISAEIQTIVTTIDTLHNELAEEQELAILSSRSDSVTWATQGVDAIPLAVDSYRAPFQMPERRIMVESTRGDGESRHPIDAAIDTFMNPGGEETLDDPDSSLGLELEDFDFDVESMAVKDVHRIEILEERRHLTYNEIWNALGFEQVPDWRKKYVFGVSGLTDLDSPHQDPNYGPVLLTGEEHLVERRWRNKIPLMRRHLGDKTKEEFDDDM